MLNLRYIVVALGGPGENEAPTEEDIATAKAVMDKSLPFTCTLLSERVSNRLTWALIEERREGA